MNRLLTDTYEALFRATGLAESCLDLIAARKDDVPKNDLAVSLKAYAKQVEASLTTHPEEEIAALVCRTFGHVDEELRHHDDDLEVIATTNVELKDSLFSDSNTKETAAWFSREQAASALLNPEDSEKAEERREQIKNLKKVADIILALRRLMGDIPRERQTMTPWHALARPEEVRHDIGIHYLSGHQYRKDGPIQKVGSAFPFTEEDFLFLNRQKTWSAKVAERDDTIAALATFDGYSTERRLRTFWVNKEYANSGIDRAIIRDLLTHGNPTLRLRHTIIVHEDDLALLLLLQSEGFAEVATIRHHFDNGENGIVMSHRRAYDAPLDSKLRKKLVTGKES